MPIPCPDRCGSAFVAVVLGYFLCPHASHGQCIDYGDYLHWVGSVDTRGYANGAAVSGSHVYVADYESGLQVVDFSDPTSRYAFAADGESGLHVVEIPTMTSPVGSLFACESGR